MPDQSSNPNLFFQGIIVWPYIRLFKVVGLGLSISFFLTILIVLGYRGRRSQLAPIPNTIIEMSEYSIPILVYLLCLFAIGILLFSGLNDINLKQRIIISGSKLKIHSDSEHQAKAINLRKADKLTFRVMPFFHKLYNDRFHRIGRLMVTKDGKKWIYYFPLRNDFVIQEMTNTILSCSKANTKNTIHSSNK